MRFARRVGCGLGRLLSTLILLAGGAAGLSDPVSAQVQSQAAAGPPSPALSACAIKVNAAPSRRQEMDAALPPVRLQALSKGVNLTDAFSPSVSRGRLEQDVAILRKLGVRHVRIPLDPGWVLSWRPDGGPDARLGRLDSTVCLALSAGLAVILDVHPEGDLALKDTAPPDTVDALARAWDRLGARYAVFTPDLMFFEALNEPALSNAGRWYAAQRILLTHIRRVAPRHTVLLTASPDSTAGALAGLTPVDDADVAYVFHFYSPMVFTHQGAEWASPNYGSVRGLVYPAERGNAAGVRDRALAAYEKPLSNYMAAYGSANSIRAEIEVAARWAASHNVPLVVTEFGVYGAVAPRDSRAAWLRDDRRALEAHSIGWTVWEYRGGFGIDGELARGCDVDSSITSALGLCAAKGASSKR